MKIFELYDGVQPNATHDTGDAGLQEKVSTGYSEHILGNWVIKISDGKIKDPKDPNSEPKFRAMALHKRQGILRGEGSTQDEAIQQIKDQISDLAGPDQTGKYSSFTIDLNVNFSNEYIRDNKNVFLKMIKDNKTPKLVMATPEYMEVYGDEMEKHGWKRATQRAFTQMAGTHWSFGLGRHEMIAAGLQPNARYTTKPEGHDQDGNEVFSLVFDSITSSSSDKVRLGVPGLTIAATMKK